MQRSQPALRVVAVGGEEVRPAEPAGLDDVFRRYSPYVAAIALRLLGRDDEVDDVVQDVFLEAVRGIHSIRDAGAVKGWLATVTVRVVRRRLRMRRLKAMFGFDDVTYIDEPVAPGASADQRALLSRVYGVLDHMAVEPRIAWVLRHIEGEKLEDVAALTGCSLATAKRRIFVAQSAIEEVFSDG